MEINTSQKTTFIYGLFDPRNYQLRYIGKTNNPQRRLYQHISMARQNVKTHRDDWIRQLLSEKLRPSIEILEETPIDRWEEAERSWIADCKKYGLKLTNLTDGGDGNSTPTIEIRLRMSEAGKGRIFSDEHKQKMKEAWIRRKELYGNNGFTNDGLIRIKTKNEKWRSENKGLFNQLNENKKGKPRSNETKEKLRQANLGKHPTSETIAKMRIANSGRKQSPETIRKKSESLKAFYRAKRENAENT